MRPRGLAFKLASALGLAALLSIGFAPGAGAAQQRYTYAWSYVRGQVLRYAYTEQQLGSTAKTTALARLTGVFPHGIGADRVRWVALHDAGHNLNAVAQAFPSYELSISPRDPSLSLPPTPIPEPLQGAVDDTLTVFVGLNSVIGITRLHHAGASYTYPRPLIGNFTNSTTPIGSDAIKLTTTLTTLTAWNATFRSAYRPPSRSALKLAAPWMRPPVCGQTPNNFEIVQAEGSQYIALWGCESFTFTTKVHRRSGHIISATEHDTLHLDGRLCPSLALTKCTAIPGVSQVRLVSIVATS